MSQLQLIQQIHLLNESFNIVATITHAQVRAKHHLQNIKPS